MKRSIVFTISLIGLLAQAQNQLPVLELGERKANLYYWDTFWYDYRVATHPEVEYSMQTFGKKKGTCGRPCYTAEPMRVIGVAAPVYLGFNDITSLLYYNVIIDTCFANRVPEFFRLYKTDRENSGYSLVAETRWDTATPTYQMHIPTTYPMFGVNDTVWFIDTCYVWSNLFDVYEAYFEEPVVVQDTFLVGGTIYNNLLHGVDSELIGHYPWMDDQWDAEGMYNHIPTFYPIPMRMCNPFVDSSCYYTVPSNMPWYFTIYEWPYNSGPLSSQCYTTDTGVVIKIYGLNNDSWLPFFPIFDTNYVPYVGSYDASCQPPTGLHIESQNAVSTTLSWDAGGDSLWQLVVLPEGVVYEEQAPVLTPINYKAVMGLDTATWYVARVRTFCDSDYFGPWSDSLKFYVPSYPACEPPTWLHVAEMNSQGVTLAWTAEVDALSWEVQMNYVDMGLSNGQITAVTTNILQKEGLNPGLWYWARVRALCNSGLTSDWSDTICFYYTGTDPVDTTSHINPVEQYTYLMPNPAREEVTVMSSFKVLSVELYASDGKLLQEQEVNALGTRLSLEGLPAGVYFVRVRTTAGVTTKRLVVESH